MSMQLGGKGLNSDINVTPFVDICLVLLVIFMVVTPMLQEGVTINLPYAKHTEKKEDDDQHAIVVAYRSVTDNVIYIQKKPVNRDQYQAEMTEVHDRMPDKPVLIKADRSMKYGDVRKVMIETNDAGFTEVSLVTEKAEGADE